MTGLITDSPQGPLAESSDYQDYVTLPFNTSTITFRELTTLVILSDTRINA